MPQSLKTRRVTSAEEGFTDSDPSVSYENDNSLTLDEKEDESTSTEHPSTEPPSTEPPAEDEKTPDKADTDKENPNPDIFTSGDDFGDGSKSNPFHVVIDSDNPEDGDAPQITDPVIDNGGIRAVGEEVIQHQTHQVKKYYINRRYY